MLNKSRGTANLKMLEFIARKLGELNEQIVYLGGCTTTLFITDPLSLDVRPTNDVDCIVDVISLGQYHKFERSLFKTGFKKSLEDDVICRWRAEDIILDVMPTDENILGFGNRWYKEAIQYANSHQIADDLIIRSITATYFLATKIEAFKTRGNYDFLTSHDFEDIITVIAGRKEVVEEALLATDELKTYLKQTFIEMLRNDQFEQTLPGHLNDGHRTATEGRVKIVKNRIKQIIEN